LLEDDHSALDKLLAEFYKAFETGELQRIYKSLDLFWACLAMHIRAEHLHLFPAILDAFSLQTRTSETNLPTTEKVKSVIEQLQDEHNFFMRELSAAIKQMRSLLEADQSQVTKQLKQVCETVIAVKNRLETHNELEEKQVYGWADSLLKASERVSLIKNMEREINNLPPRFSKN
jgi:hemerythrin-like domain-containing protein